LLLSLFVPLTIYIGAPIMGAIIGNRSHIAIDSAIFLFLLANVMVLPALILLRKFWQLNSNFSIQIIWPSRQFEIIRKDGSKEARQFSDIDHAVLVSTLSWTRRFWRGDGMLLWEPMHFATLFFNNGVKLTLTTLLVTDIPEMLNQMGVSKVHHITRFFPYPTNANL
jgi:hypothetical protein